MTRGHLPAVAVPRRGLRLQFRVWHLTLLVGYVAVAIVNVQDQRCREPKLVALASAGLAAYGLIACLAWAVARRFERRLGPMPLLALYLTGMAALFLAATVVYVVIEYRYLVGHF